MFLLVPLVSPSMTLLLVVNLLFTFLKEPPFIAPIVSDIVSRGSRGKATSLNGYGYLVSEFITFGVIIKLTSDMSVLTQYSICTGVFILAFFIFLIVLKDPDHIEDQRVLPQPSLSERIVNVKVLIRSSISAIKNNSILALTYIAGPAVRVGYEINTTFLLLWIIGFIEDCTIKNETEAKSIFANIHLFNMLAAIFVLHPVGHVMDTMHPSLSIPMVFSVRLMALVSVFFLNAPDDWSSYLVFTLIGLSNTSCNIGVDSLFNKNLPQDCRGVLNGYYNTLGNFLKIGFVLFSGYLYDTVSHTAPLFFVIIIDSFIILLILSLKACGKFENNVHASPGKLRGPKLRKVSSRKEINEKFAINNEGTV